MPMHRAEGFDQGSNDGGENPPKESTKSTSSPQKKRKKASRSQSIPAQMNNAAAAVPGPGFCPPPKGYNAPPNENMGYKPYEEHMHGNPSMHHPGIPSASPNSMQGAPMPGHPMMHGGVGLPHHMQTGLGPHSPLLAGHPPTSSVRYMRQSSVPMHPPHMSHMYPQAVSPQVGGPIGSSPGSHSMTPQYSPSVQPGAALPQDSGAMPPGGSLSSSGSMPPGGSLSSNGSMPPGGSLSSNGSMPPGGSLSSNGSMPPGGLPPVNTTANGVAPGGMAFSQANLNPGPVYPCGICQKELVESDEALHCEIGCNFWFHRKCTGMSEMAYQYLMNEVFATWACDPCMAKKEIPLIYTRS